MERRSAEVDRTRLARLLGMLGSTHDGEVANAGRLADRLVRDAGLTWGDILAPPADPAPGRLEGGDVATLLRSWPASWRSVARACRSSGGVSGLKNRQFLDAIISWQGELSERQLRWLANIAERVAGGVS